MIRKLSFVAAVAMAPALMKPAYSAPVYVALGDSITFGETDLNYVQSFGDRGYVGQFANTLAAGNGGVRPAVVNLAIDGETASSFMTNAGRTPPVVGRDDAALQLENHPFQGVSVGAGRWVAAFWLAWGAWFPGLRIGLLKPLAMAK